MRHMQFLYAAASVKSNHRGKVLVRILALITVCLSVAVLAQNAPPLAITEDTLPALDAGIDVHIVLHAKGGIPPYRWTLVSGDLPDGIRLTPDGILEGRSTKIGVFAFTVNVEDSARPAHSINKDLQTRVTASLVLDWLQPPTVQGGRIDGIAEVSNGSKDDFDLTFIVVGVNDIGRATALGYQRTTLKAGTINLQIPFGTTLPPGKYVVHADAVAEIPAKNTILRRELEAPGPLAIAQGP